MMFWHKGVFGKHAIRSILTVLFKEKNEIMLNKTLNNKENKKIYVLKNNNK
jgi:hypothetical protein